MNEVLFEMNIEYRTAEDKDLKEIYLLVKLAIENMNRQNIFQWDEMYPGEEVLYSDIKKKQLFVGTIKKKIAVIYVLNQECDNEYKNGKWKNKDGLYYIIHRLCVSPDYQNNGIAKITMAHIEKELIEKGAASIRLDAFEKNKYALRLYESLNYTKVGHADWRKGRFYLMEKVLK